MQLYISKLAQEMIFSAFNEDGIPKPSIRLNSTEEGEILEFFSIEPEEHNDEADLLLKVNGIDISINQEQVQYFDNMSLDFDETRKVFYFSKRSCI